MMKSVEVELEFLGKLQTQLSRVALTYSAYRSSGKKFLFAKILRESNESIRILLLENTHALPPEQKANALVLLHHLDVWSAIWDEHFMRKTPSLEDCFVFENSVQFPRVQVSEMISYYEKLSMNPKGDL